ncbi:uracil-DNA glycosylase [Bacillus marinisedimentorum]|uniref:uracil-DNA glycosylase n=1 Tax=Bacillus marinisedimentorum TaxID=1821260 RepID=UPI00087330CF|nr:uracil-DNA glycosylase [Bacillus marinisedimentorum]
MPLTNLHTRVVSCSRCPRLREWCITREGAEKRYEGEPYWGKPVPGFGPGNSEVLILGLAPGAHGANRTGLPFTGDSAGGFLYEALERHRFIDRNAPVEMEAVLKLKNVYITNAVKCAPPDNKPVASEFSACRPFLEEEIRLLDNCKVILALGGKAFAEAKKVLREMGAEVKGLKFTHGGIHRFGTKLPVLISSYHTSQYNISTKRMTADKFDEVLKMVKDVLE